MYPVLEITGTLEGFTGSVTFQTPLTKLGLEILYSETPPFIEDSIFLKENCKSAATNLLIALIST